MFRIIKISLAVGLLLLSIWALMLPPYFPSSSHSVVNARKIVLEAPVDGIISELPTQTKEAVTPGLAIGRIQQEQRAMHRELEQLNFMRQRLAAQLQNAKTLLQKRSSDLEITQTNFRIRQTSNIESLKKQLSSIQPQAKVYEASLTKLKEDGVRIKQLLDDGIITQAKWSEHRQRVLDAEEKLGLVESQMLQIERSLEEAKLGLEVGNSDFDEAQSSQIVSLQSEVRALIAEEHDLTAQLNEIDRQIETTRSYLSTQEYQPIINPAEGTIWRLHQINGASVRTGQVIADIADAGSIFVEAYFNRHYQENITYGDYAHILLTGSGRYIEGVVQDIQVIGETLTDATIIDPTAPTPDMLRVIISINKSLNVDDIGKITQVAISSAKPSMIQRSLIWLNFALRKHS